MKYGFQVQTVLEAAGGGGGAMGSNLYFSFFTAAKRRDSTFGYVWASYFLELNL